MSIQSNVNQLFSTASVLASMNPTLQGRAAYKQQGAAFQKGQEAAYAGIKDIESNLAERGKEYSETELKDIEARVASHNKAIYDAKSAALNPAYKNIINKETVKQNDLRQSLRNIEHEIAKRRNPETIMKDLSDRGMTKVNQNSSFDEHLKRLKETNPGTFAIYGTRALEWEDDDGN